MGFRTKSGLIAGTAMMAALLCYAEAQSLKVLWLDFDMKNIPEPKERKSDYFDYFFKGQIIEGAKREIDVPRWVREAINNPRESVNVNALDEVPDSSWYTNRHYIHHMTTEELVRGPNRGAGPDFSRVTITKAKVGGVSPGVQLKDAAGNTYLVKFDDINYPNLQSGAEVITTKILYAAGYNVPENYVAYLDPKHMEIGDKVEIKDAKTGEKRALTQDDLDQMVRRIARTPDGRLRVMASKLLAGKPKGPFSQLGFRKDDPNDLIPHEDRRELRGLRVISSWLDSWDLKEVQSMDMYVEEGGRKFLRHYLLDFGSSLGADTDPTEYYHGREYGLDGGVLLKEIGTLGIYKSGNEKRDRIVSPEIGHFTTDDFDPEHWKQTYPAIVFDNLTHADAFWATRVILSFTDDDLRAIVKTGEYSDPMTVDYIVRILLERRQMVARAWLSKVDSLGDFRLQPAADGVALTFKDLMVDNKLAYADATEYTYQIKGASYKSDKKRTGRPAITIDRATLGAAIEHGSSNAPVEVTIWTGRQDSTSEPVRIYFDWSPTRDSVAIRRIARG